MKIHKKFRTKFSILPEISFTGASFLPLSLQTKKAENPTISCKTPKRDLGEGGYQWKFMKMYHKSRFLFTFLKIGSAVDFDKMFSLDDSIFQSVVQKFLLKSNSSSKWSIVVNTAGFFIARKFMGGGTIFRKSIFSFCSCPYPLERG